VTTPTPEAPPATPRERSTALFVAAFALIAVVATLVLVFGVTRPPALLAITQANLTPPDGIAWMSWDDRDERQVLSVADVRGGGSTFDIGSGGGELVGWTDRGLALFEWKDRGRITYVDPASGIVVASEESGYGTLSLDDRDDVVVTGWGATHVRLRSNDALVWSVSASGGYTIRSGWISPDGDWVALVDSSGRILLVPADGSTPPVIWANVEPHSAPYRIVWQGTEPGA